MLSHIYTHVLVLITFPCVTIIIYIINYYNYKTSDINNCISDVLCKMQIDNYVKMIKILVYVIYMCTAKCTTDKQIETQANKNVDGYVTHVYMYHDWLNYKLSCSRRWKVRILIVVRLTNIIKITEHCSTQIPFMNEQIYSSHMIAYIIFLLLNNNMNIYVVLLFIILCIYFSYRVSC